MHWIYLSPHYDDAVFSCGGLIWQQRQAGDQVKILTVCGGGPPPGDLSPFARELHLRWGVGPEATAGRREEDAAACAVVGVTQRYLDIPDCIYRVNPATGRPLIGQNEDLFLPEPPPEEEIIALIHQALAQLPGDVRLVVPLGIGGHIDHRLTRRAAERENRPLWFYADYPYAGRKGVELEKWLPAGCHGIKVELDQAAVGKWAEASACYQSQVSTFWRSQQEMADAIAAYYGSNPTGNHVWFCEK